ncbi:hypothetical protein [Moorena bouillonii]|uniref:hypothetical protein n=1 Tax=Moorena bouillonii TaxID=207920 RepID=UPI00117EC722|nr:hypothetical protein [Moorena bouillonii]
MERASCPFHFQTSYPNPGHEAKNKGKSAPNTPYFNCSQIRCSLLPTPCSLLPAPNLQKKIPPIGG